MTNVTRLVFIFLISELQNIAFFRRPAELASTRNGDTLSLLATQILERPNMKPCRSTLNRAPRTRVLGYR